MEAQAKGLGTVGAPDRAIVPAWDHGLGDGPRHVLRREYFGVLVYDRETCQYVPYDAAAADLLLARSEGPVPAASPSEEAFLGALAAEGLIDGRGQLAARVVGDRSAADRLSAPLTVYLGATQGCNLACGHCSSGSAPGPLGALDGRLMRRLFSELHDLGCMQVHVSGGEPLLHPELLEALDVAFGLGLNVLLTTNGTLVTEALADELAKRPFRCLSVSVDGWDASSNDRVRGPGSFAAALKGLGRLARRRPTGVTATFTPALQGKLAELVRLCEEVGAASLSLRPALPSGRALKHPELIPTQADFEAATRELDRLQRDAAIPLFHPPEVPHQATSAFVVELEADGEPCPSRRLCRRRSCRQRGSAVSPRSASPGYWAGKGRWRAASRVQRDQSPASASSLRP